jgi:PEP-CTERM motif
MKFSFSRIAAIATPLLLAGVASVAIADPVVNGLFNTPTSSVVPWGTVGGNTIGPGTVTWGPGAYGYSPTNIDGWTFSSFAPGSSGAGIADDGSAFGFTATPSGAGQVAFLQLTATLSQDVTGLTVGDTYFLLFNLEGRPGSGANDLSVSIGGDTLLGPTVAANGSWTSYEEAFTATSSSEILLFSTTDATGADLTTGIDDVQILTPEPGSLLLMATGILGFGFMILRRKSSPLAAMNRIG